MADTDEKHRVTEEVDDRLDAFFSEDDWEAEDKAKAAPAAQAPAEAAGKQDDFLADEQWDDGIAEPLGADVAGDLGINELKAAILALDWEITDETMGALSKEVANLSQKWQGDNILVTFLSLLGSLSKYIARRKANALPESVTLLQGVYNNLEKVLSSKGMDRETKKQIVLAEVNRFEDFKKNIIETAKKAPPKPRPDAATVPAAGPPVEASPAEPVAAAMAPAEINELKSAVVELTRAVREIADSVAAIKKALDTNLPQLQVKGQG